MAEDEKKNKLKLLAKELMETLTSIPSLANLPTHIATQVRNLTQKKAEDKGLPWIQQIHKLLGSVPESITATKRKKEKSTKKLEKAKGGIVQVQKFSRGGTVERPRGVGIAKRGFGRVIR